MNTNQLYNSWRTATIFISSTFIDMNEERDVLNSYVLPKLNEHFNSKRIVIRLVDLRWGVRTAEIEDESARDNKVLSVCFDEIDRSQPFFVAILGDRYGYDELDRNIIDANSYKYGNTLLSKDLYGKSVTELEILYGALLRPGKQLSHSLFCIRTTDYTGMPGEVKEEYTSGISKMDSLRQKIVDSCNKYNKRDNIINYCVSGWDNKTNKFESFDKVKFGELLYNKLVVTISEHFGALDETKLSFPEQLLYEQETFLNKGDTAIGMEKRVNEILEQSCQLNIIQGESGIGKTTLLKYLARKIVLDKKKTVLYYNAGLSARCRNVKNMLICWIWQLNQIVNIKVNDIFNLNEDGLRNVLEQLLQKIVEQGREPWIIIDTYEAIYRNAVSESLSFLRYAKKSYVSTQFDTHIHFYRDLDFNVMALQGLNWEEAEKMMMGLFAQFHKEWHQNLWNIIIDKFEGSISPLWIELATDMLSSLSSQDFLKIKSLQSNSINASEALDNYLVSMVKAFPPSVPLMFAELYNKVLDEEGWSILDQFYLWYISLSRNGIRESDLAALTKQTNGWDSLLFARMRYHFHSFIKEKTVDNCWGFSHEIFSKVIEYIIKKEGERMNSDFLELAQGVLDDHLKNFLNSYVKKNDEGVYVDYLEMLHGSLGHHYVHEEENYDLRVSECLYHLLRGNDKESSAIILLNYNAERKSEEGYANAVREIADFIIENHEEKKKYYKVPKGMPIPEFGHMNNSAVIWLMDMFKTKPVIENECEARLLEIFATDVTEELNNRGSSSASLFLNMQLLSLVADNEIAIQEEQRIILLILIENNIRKAQFESGNSYDVAYRKTSDTCESNEYEQRSSNGDNRDTVPEEIGYYVYYRGEIETARKESFRGNHNKAISICEELLNKDDFFSDKIDGCIYLEAKYQCLLCLMDSYHDIGQNSKALEIYNEIEISLEKGSPRWFIIQERLFQFYYEMQSSDCLDVAEQYLSIAEQHFQKNKVRYDNIETLAHAFVLYLRALITADKGKNNKIETIIHRAERFFSQILNEYKYHKQLLKSYSYVQESEGEYYSETEKLKEAENAFKARLDICDFLSGREPLDHNASRDLIKANEDLGYFYLSCEDYFKAHEFFTDVLQYLCRWDDSEERIKRTEEAFQGLCEAMENIDEEKVYLKNEDANIRLEGYGYYYLSCKEYGKACNYFEKAIKNITNWVDSEEKYLKLAEAHVALCQAKIYVDKNESQKQITVSKSIIEGFSWELKGYFINQLESIVTD